MAENSNLNVIKKKRLDDMNKTELLKEAKELNKRLLALEESKSKEEVLLRDVNLSKLQKRVKKLEEFLEDAEERIYKNEVELNRLNQYTRRENIEIVGIPDSVKQADLEKSVLSIFTSMSIACNSYDIAACHRLSKKKDNQVSKNTIVRFICRKKVAEILSKKKMLNDDDVIKDLGCEYFICENL